MGIKSEYEQLVIGATCAGLAGALARPEGTLLVEPSASIGWEFVEAIRPGTGWEDADQSGKEAEGLRRELIDRNILHQGRVHLPAIAPVLFKRLYDSSVHYLFLTDVLEVVPGAGGYEVALFGRSGLTKVRVRRILDTTNGLVSRPAQQVEVTYRGIHAILNGSMREAQSERSRAGSQYRTVPGRFPSEVYLMLPLSNDDDDWPRARVRLHDFWTDRPAELLGADLATVAMRLAEKPVPADVRERGWRHLPSASFDNPLQAFAAGVRAAEAGWEAS